MPRLAQMFTHHNTVSCFPFYDATDKIKSSQLVLFILRAFFTLITYVCFDRSNCYVLFSELLVLLNSQPKKPAPLLA